MLYPETALRGVLLFIFLWFAFWGGVYAGRAGWKGVIVTNGFGLL